jgi:hypothetical protein
MPPGESKENLLVENNNVFNGLSLKAGDFPVEKSWGSAYNGGKSDKSALRRNVHVRFEGTSL